MAAADDFENRLLANEIALDALLAEIEELRNRTEREALTLVPLAVYFKEGRAKVELGLARGRKRHDKRAALAERDAKREAERAFADRRRGG